MAEKNFIIKNKGFEKLATGPEMKAAVLAEAEKAKVIAEGLAETFRKTGNYAGSFEVSEDEVRDQNPSYPGPRAAAFLTNTASYALAVEVGHKDERSGKEIPAQHVLSRTLEAMEASD